MGIGAVRSLEPAMPEGAYAVTVIRTGSQCGCSETWQVHFDNASSWSMELIAADGSFTPVGFETVLEGSRLSLITPNVRRLSDAPDFDVDSFMRDLDEFANINGADAAAVESERRLADLGLPVADSVEQILVEESGAHPDPILNAAWLAELLRSGVTTGVENGNTVSIKFDDLTYVLELDQEGRPLRLVEHAGADTVSTELIW